MDARRDLGERGERLAERALARRGLLTVARNARTRYGELDLVCRDRDGFVFVEVKTRLAGARVGPLDAATPRKLRRVARLAESWLALHGARGQPWRVALAAVTLDGAAARVEVVELDRL